jgi:hypothetical protein
MEKSDNLCNKNEKKICSLMKFAGMLKDIDADKIIKEIYEERKIGSRRFS